MAYYISRRRQLESQYDESRHRLPSAIFFQQKDVLGGDDEFDANEVSFHELQRISEHGQQYYCLQLLQVSMHVEVYSTISKSTLKQTFRNGSAKSIAEATYSFPLYYGSTVVSFTCEIANDRLLEGQLKPTAEAREIYRKEVAEQRTAALFQEHTPEVFEISIGNIPPQTNITVEIEYLHELKADISGESLILTVPTSIAPRYGSVPAGLSTSNVQSAHLGLEIIVDIQSPVIIRKVESPTHPVSVETDFDKPPAEAESFDDLIAEVQSDDRNSKHIRVKLNDAEATLGRDFVLAVTASSKDLLRSQALLEPARYSSDETALMVSVFPPEILNSGPAIDNFDGEVVFIADRSGSMNTKMDSLRKAMNLFVKSLPRTCHFNIISFGSNVSQLWHKSRLWSEESLNASLAHIQNDFRADMGGTNIFHALEDAVQHRLSKGVSTTQFVIVTDGEVWRTEKIVSFIKTTRLELADKVRFFALGLGEQVSHQLVESIASAGGGFAQVVTATGQSPLNRTVIKMLEGVLMPSSWEFDISLEPDPTQSAGSEHNTTDEHAQVIKSPFKNMSLHPFARRSVFFLLGSAVKQMPREIIVTARGASDSVITHKIPISQKKTSPSMLRELAAKSILEDLSSGSSWLHSQTMDHTLTESEPTQVRVAAEQLGIKYKIASKWTSFVAVDTSAQKSFGARLYHAKQAEASMNLYSSASTPHVIHPIAQGAQGLARLSRTGSAFCRQGSSDISPALSDWAATGSLRAVGSHNYSSRGREYDLYGSVNAMSSSSTYLGEQARSHNDDVRCRESLPIGDRFYATSAAPQETSYDLSTTAGEPVVREARTSLSARSARRQEAGKVLQRSAPRSSSPTSADAPSQPEEFNYNVRSGPRVSPECESYRSAPPRRMPKDVSTLTDDGVDLSSARASPPLRQSRQLDPNTSIRFCSSSPPPPPPSDSPSRPRRSYNDIRSREPVTDEWETIYHEAPPRPAYNYLSTTQTGQRNPPDWRRVRRRILRDEQTEVGPPDYGSNNFLYFLPPSTSPSQPQSQPPPPLTLDLIVDRQQSDGSFSIEDDLQTRLIAKFATFNRQNLTTLSSTLSAAEGFGKGKERMIFDTIMAMLYMMVHCADQEDEWKFIGRHALKWLEQCRLDKIEFQKASMEILC